MIPISAELRAVMRVPYALRHVPAERFVHLLSVPQVPRQGSIYLAVLEKIGKNARVELADGRLSAIREGDVLAVVFGNRYATQQFEGYAETRGDCCDLLSIAGLCGVVKSKHASVSDPSKLRLLGAVADAEGRLLLLSEHGRPVRAGHAGTPANVVVVCGTSMDSGKTHAAMSLIMGLNKAGHRVAGIKLTGTAAGRDTWTMRDAGACVALDFGDVGAPSTYLCKLDDLLEIHTRLLACAATHGANWAVVEIADGLLQRETALLLRERSFVATINAWIFASGDALGAVGGVSLLRSLRIEPLALTGLMSMSPLAMREAHAATGTRCVTAREMQQGGLNSCLAECVDPPRTGSPQAAPGRMSAA